MLQIDLSGQVVLVVGGSRGIGAGITEALARAGAHVCFTHRGRAERESVVGSLVERVRKEGGTAEPIVADACDSKQMKQAVARVLSQRGRVDGLVCNVGQTIATPAEQVSDEEWRYLIDTNLSSSFYAVREVLPTMLDQKRGRVVFIGSSVVHDGGGGSAAYCASKAGLAGMMLYLMRNYARRGVLTNIVHPCVIDTELLRERYDDEAKREKLAQQVPAGRLGTPADIAGLVAFLLSPMGDFIAGQEILVDGGRTVFK